MDRPGGAEVANYSVPITSALGENLKIHRRSPQVLLPGDWHAWPAGTVASAKDGADKRVRAKPTHANG